MLKKCFVLTMALMLLLALAACGSADTGAPFSGGTGTEADPYRIATAQDLRQLAELINDRDTMDAYFEAFYILTADIDLGGKAWTPIGDDSADGWCRFAGSFDGQGHTVSGISIRYSKPLAGDPRLSHGLFGEVHGTIRNLTVSDSTIEVGGGISAATGAVAGKVRDGVIENCHTTESVSITGCYQTGGICGSISADTPVRGCTNAASVTAQEMGTAAGIVAYGNCAIVQCSNSGTISSVEDAAGICGNANFGISDCTNTGSVEAVGKAAGIICTFEDGALNSNMNNAAVTLERCTNSGSVTSMGKESSDGVLVAKPAGGIAAICRTGIIRDCANSGTVTTCAEAGGIVGLLQTSSFGTACEEFSITGCVNSGGVISNGLGQTAGGICGRVYGDVAAASFENCENTGRVQGNGGRDVAVGANSAGGIIGSATYTVRLTVSGCVNGGSVEGFDEAGGIIGRVNASREVSGVVRVDSCTNSGSVYVRFSGGLTKEIYAGGIIGYYDSVPSDVNPGIITAEFTGCANTGSLDGENAPSLCTDDLAASDRSRME